MTPSLQMRKSGLFYYLCTRYAKYSSHSGRTNVGKSTLFNRLTETRQAITDETAGVHAIAITEMRVQA